MRLRLNPVPWLRAHVVTLGALLFVCAQVGCTAISLAHFYFRQADFGILDRAAGSGFGWKYLMWLGGARDGHRVDAGPGVAVRLAAGPRGHHIPGGGCLACPASPAGSDSGISPAGPGLASRLYELAGTLMTFDARGRLRPVTVQGPARSRLHGCWNLNSGVRSITLGGSLYRWPWTARLAYSGPAGLPGSASAGPGTRSWSRPVSMSSTCPVVGQGSTVSLQFAGPATQALCVTGVTVGSLHPDLAGRASPAAPVPG